MTRRRTPQKLPLWFALLYIVIIFIGISMAILAGF